MQGLPREFRGPGAKEEDKPPASEASRKVSWSRTLLFKIIASLPYEAPHTLKNLVI